MTYRAESTAAEIQHEIVVTARLLCFWKNESALGGARTAIQKRDACEQHLERLLVILDAAVVRARMSASDTPANAPHAPAKKSASR